MATVVESGIEFSYGAAVVFHRHDAENRQWPAVDFIIDEGTRWIWLEVKNWEPSTIPPRLRGSRRRSFLAKMRSSVFFAGTLRGKFLGTSAFLAHSGAFPAKPVLYVVLLESPRMDAALLLHATGRLNQQVWPGGPWQHTISGVVVNLNEWNRRFPGYPARAV